LQIHLITWLYVAQQLNDARHGLPTAHIGPVHRHYEIAGADAGLLRRASRADFAHTRSRFTARIVELYANKNARRTGHCLDALHHRSVHLRGERRELLRCNLEAATRLLHLGAQHIFALPSFIRAVARCLHTGTHGGLIDIRWV
jgi:hypothetical protein